MLNLSVHSPASGSNTGGDILLLHGLTNDSNTWHGLVTDLNAAGFRVVTVDLPGHGKSPLAVPLKISSFGDAVWQTLVTHGFSGNTWLTVLGHSLGGLVAEKLLGRLQARSVIFADPGWRGFADGSKIPSFKVQKLFTYADLAAIHKNWSTEALHRKAQALIDWDANSVEILLDMPTHTPQSYTFPVLLLLAEHDSTVGPAVTQLATDAGYQVRVVPNAGHVIQSDNPQFFNDSVLTWLNNLTLSNSK